MKLAFIFPVAVLERLLAAIGFLMSGVDYYFVFIKRSANYTAIQFYQTLLAKGIEVDDFIYANVAGIVCEMQIKIRCMRYAEISGIFQTKIDTNRIQSEEGGIA